MITISFSYLLAMILRSLMKNPFLVSMQFPLVKAPEMYSFFGSM
jgi:hypothetical protein